jgi:hypothetical protein
MRSSSAVAEEIVTRTRKLMFFLILVLIWITPVNASNPTNSNKKGLALTGSQPSDADLLGASWWYVYTVWEEHLSDPRYVPMLPEGLPDDALPNTWSGHILVFNEPSLLGITPSEGASRYIALIELYPKAKLVIGGIAEAQVDWAQEFMENLKGVNEPDFWHVHHYFASNTEQVIEDIKQFYDVVKKPLWITEFGSVNSDVFATESFLVWIESRPWIERYAYFPTRMNKDFYWFPESWSDDMALVEWHQDDVMPLGEVYRDFEIFQVFIPLLESNP